MLETRNGKTKTKQMAKIPVWVWAAVIVVGVLAYQGGYLDNILGGSNNNDDNGNFAPSTGLTAITLNTKDALASTDTNANVSYYIFSKDGKFQKSGTTSAGTATVNVNYGAVYDVIAFSDSTYYPIRTEISAMDGASKSVNIGLNPVSNVTISSVRDPLDLNTNISLGLGAQSSFEVVYYTTTASSSTNKPVIVVDANQTSIQDVSMSGLTEVTCPTRLTNAAGRIKYCFQAATLKSSDGPVIAKGTVLASSSVTPLTTDTLSVVVIDTQGYLNPNYVTAGISGYNEGTENKNTNANVGASDSAASTISFQG